MQLGRTGKKRSRRLAIVSVVFVIIVVILFRGFLPRLVAPVVSSFVFTATWVSQKTFWFQEAKQITAQEIEALYSQREALAIDQAELAKVKQENQNLREELGFTQRTQVRFIAADVLTKSISHSVSRFVIDVGSEHGVQEGAAVVTGEGLFVGKLTSLGARSSTVTALTDPNLSVAVSLLNQSRTIGLATGSVGDLLRIDFIPVDEQIEQNTLVITSGLESPIPSGMLVGIVNAIEQETGSPFQHAIMEPLANIRLISSVLVLKPDENPL
jgi:rod shape-determining protein MreC